MILVKNTRKYQRHPFGDRLTRLWLPRHKVYYENLAVIPGGDNVPAFTSSPQPSLGDLAFLTNDIYQEYVKWDASKITLAGIFAGQRVDAIILGNCSADYISGTVGDVQIGRSYLKTGGRQHINTDGGERLYIDDGESGLAGKIPIARTLAPEAEELDVTDQNIVIFELPEGTEAWNFNITIEGAAPITLNKFYIGKSRSWLPAGNYTYTLEGRGHGNITDIGIVYGYTMPSVRTLECKFDFINDVDRREIEKYINTVQNVKPHFVSAHKEDCYIPPMFAALNEQKLTNTKQKNSWIWSGASLKYTEAK
jgi:hypothetical protein